MLPPEKWPEENLASICNDYLHVMEVHVDDFCTMVQTDNPAHLRHISRLLLHAIQSVFPPPEVSGLDGGDPISYKNLLEGEGGMGYKKRYSLMGVRWCTAVHQTTSQEAQFSHRRFKGHPPSARHPLQTI